MEPLTHQFFNSLAELKVFEPHEISKSNKNFHFPIRDSVLQYICDLFELRIEEIQLQFLNKEYKSL